MSYISKERFCEMMNEFDKSRESIKRIDSIVKEDPLIRGAIDFFSASCLCAPAESVAVELLKAMFDDDGNMIEYWMYELDFGRKWESGCILDDEGRDIVLRDAGELYDYLVENAMSKDMVDFMKAIGL